MKDSRDASIPGGVEEPWHARFEKGKWYYRGPLRALRGLYIYNGLAKGGLRMCSVDLGHTMLLLENEQYEWVAESALITTPGLADSGPDNFTKHDTAKPDLAILPLSGLEAWAAVLTYGEQKYSRNNWRLAGPEDEIRLRNAALRHLYQFNEARERGEPGLDEESGLSHLWHCMANLGFLVDLAERSKKK